MLRPLDEEPIEWHGEWGFWSFMDVFEGMNSNFGIGASLEPSTDWAGTTYASTVVLASGSIWKTLASEFWSINYFSEIFFLFETSVAYDLAVPDFNPLLSPYHISYFRYFGLNI